MATMLALHVTAGQWLTGRRSTAVGRRSHARNPGSCDNLAVGAANAAVAAEAPEAHGSVLATFCTITYAGLRLPAIAAGLLVTYQGMSAAVDEFSVAATIACALILAFNLRAGHATRVA